MTAGIVPFLLANWTLSLPLLLLIIILVVIEVRSRTGSRAQLSPKEAVQFINQKKSLIIDLRNTGDFAQGHIAKAKNFAADALKRDVSPLKKHKDTPVLVVCQAGVSSARFVSWLRQQGFNHVAGLAGGMQQWTRDKLPVIKQ